MPCIGGFGGLKAKQKSQLNPKDPVWGSLIQLNELGINIPVFQKGKHSTDRVSK